MAGSTKSTVAFFTSKGHCYVTRIADIPASTGYGDPIQKLFKFTDGELVIGAISFDSRVLELPEVEKTYEDGSPCPPYGVAITKRGQGFSFPLFAHRETSNRNGRKFARLNTEDSVLCVLFQLSEQNTFLIMAAQDGHALGINTDELSILSRPGKGTIVMKLDPGNELSGAKLINDPDNQSLEMMTDKGKVVSLTLDMTLGARGAKGKQVIKKGTFNEPVHILPEVPTIGHEQE